jgi:hypothetical protein
MRRKPVLIMAQIAVLLGMLSVTFRVHRVVATGTTIYMDGNKFADPYEDDARACLLPCHPLPCF